MVVAAQIERRVEAAVKRSVGCRVVTADGGNIRKKHPVYL